MIEIFRVCLVGLVGEDRRVNRPNRQRPITWAGMRLVATLQTMMDRFIWGELFQREGLAFHVRYLRSTGIQR
jgi:hypothetical protein